jgi:hypothetical protein
LGNGDGTFLAKVDYATGSVPFSVTTGDFNADGKLDVATVNWLWPSTVSILLGNGDGTFQARVDFATGAGPVSVAAGDFNGDGMLDLATADQGANAVSILLQAAAVQLSTTSLNFGDQLVNTTSGVMQVTLTNTGTATLNFTSFNVQISTGDTTPSPDFQSNNTCGNSLGTGLSCTINAFFTPSLPGLRTGVIKIIDDASDSPQFITLSGTGLSAGVVTPSVPNLNFGSHAVGTMTTQTITLTNTGSGTLNILGLTFTGNFALDDTTTCPSFGSLAASASCDIGITFSPYVLGANNGQLAITYDAVGSPNVVSLSGTGTAVAFARGEVFVAVADGKVQRHRATGELIQVLDTTLGGFTTGMAFDRAGILYVTAFSVSNVSRFDSNGVLLGTFGSGYSMPEVIVFDQGGNVFVGNTGGGIRKFDPDGNLLESLIPSTRIDFMDLSADQTTMLITQEGQNILTLDLTTGLQGPDFATNLGGRAFALRILPDGGVLLANRANVRRLDASGLIIQTYDVAGEDCWFALNLDPDGTSFWSADFCTSNVHKFDINSGQQLFSFNSGTSSGTVFGLTLFGEITVGAGTGNVGLSATSLTLPGTPLDRTCNPRTVTVSNTGGTPIAISSITTNSGEFTATNNCPGSLNPGATCTISVVFHPSALGLRQGTLTITSDDPRSPHTVALEGEGLPACRLVASRRSALVLRGTASTDFEVSDASPSCSPEPLELSCSLNDPATCSFSPAIIPPSGRSALRLGNLAALKAELLSFVVNSRSDFRTASVGLTVLVKDFAFTTAPAVVAVEAGGTASYALAIRPVNGFTGTLSFSCSGAPRGARCTVEPGQVTLDGASLAQVRVNVRTTARAMGAPRGRLGPPTGRFRNWPFVLGLMLLMMLAMRAGTSRRPARPGPSVRERAGEGLRYKRASVVLAAAMLMVLLWAACGGGGLVSTTGTSGTPPGTSALTVTGTYTTTPEETAAGAPSQVTGTTSLTLTVR